MNAFIAIFPITLGLVALLVITPLIAQFGTGGSFYLTEETYGLELY